MYTILTFDTPRVLSRQSGALVVRRGAVVEKSGRRVKPCEEAALRLVQNHTNVPVPTVYSSSFTEENEENNGCISMSYIDSEPLDSLWDEIEDQYKKVICRQVWDLIYQFRTIPKPDAYADHFQCCADGSVSNDVLIKPLPMHSGDPLPSDTALRQRVYDRYYFYGGRRYEHELLHMLPRSENSVFTHADIAPRNILLGEGDDCPIVGIVDWENAGWYPDYWEYANMMRPANDGDWQMWMQRTAPEQWNISGIKAARRVLF